MRVALLIGVVLLAFAPAVARAGTYDVTLCADPAAPGFTERNDDRTALTSTVSCPGNTTTYESGVFAAIKDGTTAPGVGKVAGWTVSAPAGARLRAFAYVRQYGKTTTGYEVAVTTPEELLEGCSAPKNGCIEPLEPAIFSLNTASISFIVRCAVAPCVNSLGQRPAWLVIKSATATIQDTQAPTVAAPVVPAGWQRTAAISFGAEDNTGLRTLVLRDGAAALDTRAQTCDLRHLQPCPLKVSASATPDLADGVHSLTAVATDAGGETTTSAAAQLRIDRTAPAAPLDLAVQRTPDGSYVYTWRNPDQIGSPIAAAHLSDGTVVRGSNLTQLTTLTGDARLYLEDEAGNSDATTATGVTLGVPVGVQKPILQTTADPAKLKITSATKSGTKLIVKGTIARTITGKLTATVTRGSRSAKATAKAAGGRFTIKVSLSSVLRRKGTNTLTVRFAGQGNFGAATVSRKLTIR